MENVSIFTSLFLGLFLLLIAILIIIAPLMIWSECREIRKKLTKVVELLQGDSGAAKVRGKYSSLRA